jgi:hypothetical protein
MIYDKVLKVKASNMQFEQGEIVNFMQIDSDKVLTLAWVFPQVAKIPITLFFAWGLLFYLIGVSLLGSIVIGAVILWFNY